MPVNKQMQLVDELLSKLTNEEVQLCRPVAAYLMELGYTPRKHKKSSFTLAFEKRGRVIAKLEHGRAHKTDTTPSLTFWLRFSASEEYSQLFQAAVNLRPAAWVKSGKQYPTLAEADCCGNCKGKPRFYTYVREDGSRFTGCGGFLKRVPGVTPEHVPEILRLIQEQDAYFAEMLD